MRVDITRLVAITGDARLRYGDKAISFADRLPFMQIYWDQIGAKMSEVTERVMPLMGFHRAWLLQHNEVPKLHYVGMLERMWIEFANDENAVLFKLKFL